MPSGVRRLQGAVLVLGGVAFYVLEGLLDVGFHWTPFLVGTAYLAAAALGGPRGSYWSTAVALVGFGLGPLAIFVVHVDVSTSAAYVVAIGLGVLAAGLLAERGWAITATAVGAAVLAAGVIYALQPHWDLVTEPAAYAAGLVLVGMVRIARGESAGAGHEAAT